MKFNYALSRSVLVAILSLVFLSRSPVSAGFVVDHRHVDLTDTIPQQVLDNARNLDLLFAHMSVGNNIIDGLKDLSAANPTRYKLNFRNTPDQNWYSSYNGLGDFAGGTNGSYTTKIANFNNIVSTEGYGSVVDAAMMKFCYVDIYSSGSDSYQNPTTVWSNYQTAMTNLRNKYPGLKLVYWTMPLQTYDDDANVRTHQLNEMIRNYAANNDVILFDIADIESYNPTGNRCCDQSVDGSSSCSGGAIPALCSGYTVDGGHLNDSSNVGRKRAAKGVWYLMAYLAGLSSPTPTSTLKPGDANADDRVDGVDYMVWRNHYGQYISGSRNGDFDNSGKVDGVDYMIWRNNYGK